MRDLRLYQKTERHQNLAKVHHEIKVHFEQATFLEVIKYNMTKAKKQQQFKY